MVFTAVFAFFGCGEREPSESERLAHELELAERSLIDGRIEEAAGRIDGVFETIQADPMFSDPAVIVGAHYARGILRRERAEFDGAIADLNQARRIARQVRARQTELNVTSELSVAYDLAGRNEDAEREFRTLIDAYTARDGAGAISVLRTKVSLGVCISLQGRCEEAVPIIREAEQALAAQLPGDGLLGVAWSGLAGCAFDAQNYQEALTLYERTLVLRRQDLGTEHPRVATTEHNIAVSLMNLGRREEALTHANEALRIRQSLPEHHPWRLATEALVRDLGVAVVH